MMKFTSGCGADLPGSNRNKVNKFRINQEKMAPTYCTEGTKQQKFRINLKKACWNDQKCDETPKFRGILPCSGPILPFSAKADMFCNAFSKPCRIFPNAAIPFLFHHAFSEHFIMILPTLPFFTKADMVNPPPPTTLFGNPFWSASPPLSPIIPGLGL